MAAPSGVSRFRGAGWPPVWSNYAPCRSRAPGRGRGVVRRLAGGRTGGGRPAPHRVPGAAGPGRAEEIAILDHEAHDLIIKAWTSPELFQWISPNYEYRYVNLWPRPQGA